MIISLYNRNDHLRQHKRIHTIEKPLNDICESAFKCASSLKKHNQIHSYL